MNFHELAFWIGILIVVLSHVYSLVRPNKPLTSMKVHSAVNLFAAALIIFNKLR